MRRLTECGSMYSDMSMRTIAWSLSNRNSASARASSVLPTPVGPRKMKLPSGRFGSESPARARRIAFALQLHDPPLALVEFDRHRGDLHPQLGGRLVDQIDRFVRQEAVGDVAV